MRFTRRDGLATVFVAWATVLYALWLNGTVAQDESTRVLGAIVFGLGYAACMSNQSEMAVVYGVGARKGAPIGYVVLSSLLGGLALVAAVITIVSGNEAMLATLVAAMIALWVMASARHALAHTTREHDHRVPGHLENAA